MLKLVFANKTYDIDYSAGFSGIMNITGNLASGTDYSSLYSNIVEVREKATTTIKSFVVDIESNLRPTPTKSTD